MLYTLIMAALYVAAVFLMNYEPRDADTYCAEEQDRYD